MNILRDLIIDALTLDPDNVRTHDSRNIGAIADSLRQFGQRKPIVVRGNDRDGYTVVAGNGTITAAREIGWTTIDAVAVPDDWTDDQVRAFAIADNRTAELAEWDMDALHGQLEGLEIGGWDLGSLGFDELTFDDMEIEEDEVPELDDTPPTTKPGDLWLLGEHRLICGDSTDPSNIGRLMGGNTARMMFTDPPWNVAIGMDSNPRHRQRKGLDNDDLSAEDFQSFLDGFVQACKPHVSGDVYCVLGASEWPRLDATLRSHGYHWSATVIWVKDSFVLGRSKYHRRYEPIWYGWSKNGKSSFCDRRDLDDVWEIPRPRRSEDHPTMKPVEVPARGISSSSKQGEIVLDPFGGSGSTLIAAEQLGRVCYTSELDPGYCDVIVRRWESMTGKVARLENRNANA